MQSYGLTNTSGPQHALHVLQVVVNLVHTHSFGHQVRRVRPPANLPNIVFVWGTFAASIALLHRRGGSSYSFPLECPILRLKHLHTHICWVFFRTPDTFVTQPLILMWLSQRLRPRLLRCLSWCCAECCSSSWCNDCLNICIRHLSTFVSLGSRPSSSRCRCLIH